MLSKDASKTRAATSREKAIQLQRSSTDAEIAKASEVLQRLRNMAETMAALKIEIKALSTAQPVLSSTIVTRVLADIVNDIHDVNTYIETGRSL